LTRAVNAYERHDYKQVEAGIHSLAAMRHVSFYIFDETGKLLTGDGTPPRFYEQMVRGTSRDGHPALMWGDSVHYMFLLLRVNRASAMSRADSVPAKQPDSPFSLLGISDGGDAYRGPGMPRLSLYLTRPITKLRSTAQRLAGGDLDARAASFDIRRSDELGDLARDFDRMAAQIQSLLTAQRCFVADVSHELGAPLTRMHLALALLRRRFAETECGELARIERETDKLSDLVQQLLLLAGLEAGCRPAENLTAVSVRSLCASIVEDANFEAAQASCQVTGSREDVTLLAYPQLLRRAIDNVLRNALRYAPAGSEIRLDCKTGNNHENILMQ
jgi:two-component system sensor histidine kinase CpxA